jgi:hypothetical protein
METSVLCFRAFDQTLVERWCLLRGTLKEVDTTLEQKHNQMIAIKGDA